MSEQEPTLSELEYRHGLLGRSSLVVHAGRSGLKIKPVYGWIFLLLLVFFLTTAAFIWSLLWDFGHWVQYSLVYAGTCIMFSLVAAQIGLNRQLDKQTWIHAGNLGDFPLTITTPRGSHVQLLDMQHYLQQKGQYVKPGQHLMRVTRPLWQPGGVAAGVGADGGKDMGHLGPIASVEVSEDAGRTWSLVYYHPIIKSGDRYVYFQYLVPTPADKLPEGMLQELVNCYPEDVTTGEVSVGEGYETFGTLLGQKRCTCGAVVDVRQALDSVFFPQGILPPPPLIVEAANLRARNAELLSRNDDLLKQLNKAEARIGEMGIIG